MCKIFRKFLRKSRFLVRAEFFFQTGQKNVKKNSNADKFKKNSNFERDIVGKMFNRALYDDPWDSTALWTPEAPRGQPQRP